MKSTHNWEVEVQWGHCDPAGIVFYPNFYGWFDAATHALLDGLGFTHNVLKERFAITGCGLIETGATFHAPARDGDVLRFESSIADVTNRTFRIEHVVTCGQTSICTGHEVRGCFVDDAAKPNGIAAISIPADLRSALRE